MTLQLYLMFVLDYRIETCIKVSMFKRNQVDAAIGAALEGHPDGASEELRTKMKRLLDTDRTLDVDHIALVRSHQHYAFYGAEPPGRGTEVWFSAYESFALLMGLQLMQHGWSQTFAVTLLRDARSVLEKVHAKILQLDPDRLFDQQAISRTRRAGDPAFETTDPHFLVIVMQHGVERRNQNRPFKTSVQENMSAAMRWIAHETRGIGGGAATFEITLPALQLQKQLSRTAPKPRGRST